MYITLLIIMIVEFPVMVQSYATNELTTGTPGIISNSSEKGFTLTVISVLYKIIVFLTTTGEHRWDLPVLHYHKIMVIYPYPFLVVINQLFSWIIFINDCISILIGSSG